jgi:hypothetical protein
MFIFRDCEYDLKKKFMMCMKIFTLSPQKGWFGGKLKFLNIIPIEWHIILKVLIKEDEWCKPEVSTMILRKVMAVQSLKFLKFNILINNEKQRFFT